MRVFIIGSKELSCLILDEVLKQGHEVLGVYSRDHEPGMMVWHELGHRSLKELAERNNIPVHQGMKVNSGESVELLRSLDLDIILSCFWGEIVKEPVLNIARLGMYNFHTAYLPKNRGSRPIPWALIEGEAHCGITLHRMLAGIDNGPIVDQEKVSIGVDDTAASLYEQVTKAGHQLVTRNLERFVKNDFPLISQQEEAASYHPRGEPSGGQINAYWTEEKKERFIRAFHFPPFRAHREAPKAYMDDSSPQVYWVIGEEIPRFDLPSNAQGWKQNNIGDPQERRALKTYFATAKSTGVHISEPIGGMFPVHDVLAGLNIPFVVSLLIRPDAFLEHPERSQPFRYENGLLEIPALECDESTNLVAFQDAAEAQCRKHERDIFVPVIAKNFKAPNGRTLTFSEVHDHFNTPYHGTSD